MKNLKWGTSWHTYLWKIFKLKIFLLKGKIYNTFIIWNKEKTCIKGVTEGNDITQNGSENTH